MKRPTLITVICILGYLSIMFTFPQVFSPQVKKLGVWMPALYGLLVAGSFMSYVGLWYYKRWGVLLFLITYFTKTILNLFFNEFGFTFYFGQIMSVTFIIIFIRFYPRMDQNL